MSADRLADSLAELDPENRALLELSMVRGIADADLANMLGGDAQRLRQRRRAVLDSLGVESPAERAALVASLRGEQAPAEVEPPREARRPAEDSSDGERSPGRGSRRLLSALAGGLFIAAVVALVLALGSDEKDPDRTAQPPRSAKESDAPAPPPAGAPPVALAPLAPGSARATAQIVVGGGEPKLRLRVRGLPKAPEGGYVVWLYNSASDAKELSGSRTGAFSISPPLPPEADRYRFLDISREPADGNRNHSGASVLRVPVEKIPRTARGN